MEDINQNNKIAQGDLIVADKCDFKYNFINIPWDNRSLTSKIGIIALLLATFLAIMVCVIINFVVHYKGYYNNKITDDIKCHFVKMEDHRFVARIHSASTNELLCVGAVVSRTSVLANGVCVKSGPTRLRMGSFTDPGCKKGFPVDIIEPIYHDGVVSKILVLLSTFENMVDCTNVIPIGKKLDLESQVYIFGRPLRVEKYLSHQPATVADSEKLNMLMSFKSLNKKNMICIKGLTQCPVRTGDLLVQNDQLYGLALTSVHRTDRSYKIACFADLKVVQRELEEPDGEMKVRE